MANTRLSMRKIKQVLRLSWVAKMSARAIARSLKTSPSTIIDYLRRAQAAQLDWAHVEALDDGALERWLFPAPAPSAQARPLPDWADVHRELRGKGVTLTLLWLEYKATYCEGIQYSQFCVHYRAWAAKLDVVMRAKNTAPVRSCLSITPGTGPRSSTRAPVRCAMRKCSWPL